jgi:hypothetical protein
MSTSWVPGVLHRAERAMPAPVRRLIKRLAPSLIAGAHRLILSAAPAHAAEATIADGPLRGAASSAVRVSKRTTSSARTSRTSPRGLRGTSPPQA